MGSSRFRSPPPKQPSNLRQRFERLVLLGELNSKGMSKGSGWDWELTQLVCLVLFLLYGACLDNEKGNFMTEKDLLDDLLQTNLNEPASKAMMILLRGEMKSGFQAMERRFEQRFEQVDQKLVEVMTLLDVLAKQMAVVLQRLP